jgi:hypothetical protein
MEIPVNKHSRQATSKTGKVVDCRADLLNQRTALKTELPHHARGEAAQTAAAEG